MRKSPVGILLAAGYSRRFGSNKLLYPVIDDTPMLMVSAQKLVSVLPSSVAVINRQLAEYANDLEKLGFQVVINEQANAGMGSSIACGVRSSQHANAWLIALADMPYVKVETIQALADKLRQGAPIVAPFFGQQRGHPVGFNQTYKDALCALDGDIGARDIIAGHKKQLEDIQTIDEGVVTDIDLEKDVLG
jgi:molybdenum cofactor cytidylyltransferase